MNNNFFSIQRHFVVLLTILSLLSIPLLPAFDSFSTVYAADVTTTKTANGAVALGNGVIEIELDNDSVLDISAGISDRSGDNIEIDGSSLDLKTFDIYDSLTDLTSKTPTNISGTLSIGEENLTIQKGVMLESGTDDSGMTLKNTDYYSGEIYAIIPDETIFLGTTNFTGIIEPTISLSNPEGNAPEGYDFDTPRFEIGDTSSTIIFNKPVTIIINRKIEAMSFKPVAEDEDWTLMSPCEGNYENPTIPDFPGECFKNDGTSESKIITYHFTQFSDLEESTLSTQDDDDDNDDSDDNTSEEENDSEENFPDIEGNTFEEYINNLADDDIISGFSDGKYYPDRQITRAQMAKFIVNAFDFPISTSGDKFPDVEDMTNELSRYIQTLKNLDIVGGYSDGTYKPDENVTRGAVTKFIVNALEEKGKEIDLDIPDGYTIDNFFHQDLGIDCDFPDVYYYNRFLLHINYLENISVGGEKIIKGYSDGSFKPDDELTRGQMAKIVDLARQVETE